MRAMTPGRMPNQDKFPATLPAVPPALWRRMPGPSIRSKTTYPAVSTSGAPRSPSALRAAMVLGVPSSLSERQVESLVSRGVPPPKTGFRVLSASVSGLARDRMWRLYLHRLTVPRLRHHELLFGMSRASKTRCRPSRCQRRAKLTPFCWNPSGSRGSVFRRHRHTQGLRNDGANGDPLCRRVKTAAERPRRLDYPIQA